MRVIYMVALGAALAASTAQADTPTQPKRAVVTHADLDLATVAGRDALEQRVKKAIRAVCDRPVVNLQSFMDQSNCQRRAKEEAAPQVRLAVQHRSNTTIAIRY